MKKIILTKQQLNEVVDIAVNVEKDGDVNSAMSSAKEEADDALGINTERNYVVNIEENETNLTGDEKIKQINSAIDLFWENCESDGDFEEEFIGHNGSFNEAEVMDFIMGNVSFDVSNDDYSLIKNMFSKTLRLRESVVYSFTKKQLTEKRLMLEVNDVEYQSEIIGRAINALVALSNEIYNFDNYKSLAIEFYAAEDEWEEIESELNYQRKYGDTIHYSEDEITNAKKRYDIALSNFPVESQVEFDSIKKNINKYGSIAIDAIAGLDYENDIFPNLIKSLFDGSLSSKLNDVMRGDEYTM